MDRQCLSRQEPHAAMTDSDNNGVAPKRTFTGPVFGLLALLVADAALGQVGGSNAVETGMEIRILIEGTALAATLEDHAASRDFVAQLPLALTSEGHTSELQSLMRISCAVFLLKNKKEHTHHATHD